MKTNSAFYQTFHVRGQGVVLPVYRAIQYDTKNVPAIVKLCGEHIRHLPTRAGVWLVEDLHHARKHVIHSDEDFKAQFEPYDARYILSGGNKC